MAKNKLYIGVREIKLKLDNPDDVDGLIITFKDGKEVKLKKRLYELIVKPVKAKGDTVNEVANAYIVTEFLLKLAEYGYERYQVEAVATALGVLIHNLTEEKIGKKFGVDNSDRIKLADILC